MPDETRHGIATANAPLCSGRRRPAAVLRGLLPGGSLIGMAAWIAALAIVLPWIAPSAVFAQDAGATQAAAAPTALRAPSHRGLRTNQPPVGPNPVAPSPFAGYAGAPAFTVFPQKNQIVLFPCSQCHAVKPPDPTPRALVGAPHVGAQPHGNGRMWCMSCHKLDQRDLLVTLAGDPVDFDDAHLVCGQCHGIRHREWHFGAHGKRVANWSGERVLFNCTHCHDPHNPVLQPRKPSKPPPVRAGLARTPHRPEGAPAAAAVPPNPGKSP